MPLSQAEKHLVYEALGIPNATSVVNVNSDFGTGSRFQSFAVTTAKTSVDAILDALETAETGGDLEAAAKIARLQVLLVQWEKVAISATNLSPQATNQGVSRRPAHIRRLVRTRIQRVVPVFLEQDFTGGTALPVG